MGLSNQPLQRGGCIIEVDCIASAVLGLERWLFYRGTVHALQYSMHSSGHVTCTKAALTVGEVKGGGRLRRPQSHCVDVVAAIPRDGVVIRNRHHHLGVLPPIHLGSAVEVDRNGIFGTRELPRVAIAQPVVWFLHLQGEEWKGCDRG